MNKLDLLSFPLDSLSLIEASAGTGKTFAVANLYLRYLLERHFTVEQILVVTFTEAATQELKDRIRLRIQELRRVFEGEESRDSILIQLVKGSTNPEEDKVRLRLAERQIDQAQIHTIHGFCQLVLKQYSLDANVPLTQKLLEDQTQLRKQVLEDFWRREVLSLPETALAFLIQKWPDPSKLQSAFSGLLNRTPDRLIPISNQGGLAFWLQQLQETHAWYECLRDTSLEMIDEVEHLLIEMPLKRNNDKLGWVKKIRAWASAPDIDYTLPKANKDIVFERFSTSALATEGQKNKPVPLHPYFDFLETHFQQTLPDLYASFLAQSYPLIKHMIAETKQQQRVFSFDDLITRVAKALPATIENGQSNDVYDDLARRISENYQVAIIDEFQDTDPQQYHIFNRLFGTQSPKKIARLVLIGDPKQAIYGFRGGDISTYLRAKRDIASHSMGQLFTMDTNWRSSSNMVQAVNTLFGDFDNAFLADDIPFQSVNAAKPNLQGLPPQSVIISYSEAEKISKPQLEQRLADHCVSQIEDLLRQAETIQLDDKRSLKHSDIAVLVRSSKEGEKIKSALAEKGLVATLDSQESIYLSEEALALNYLLEAVADPHNETALRRCLAEPFFGITDQQILEFNEQADVFAHYLDIFESLHRTWLNAGVLSMIRTALKSLGVFGFWLNASASTVVETESRMWERRLTNWNQLAEILQKQSRIHTGHFGLIRWYQDTLNGVRSENESSKGDSETSLRLESDAALIRIITIHKSKGLEYPFVFLPFMISCRGATEAWFYDEKGSLSLDLAGSNAYLIAAERERLAEDIRLLYVALTRSKYRCYIGTAAYQSTNRNFYGLTYTAWAHLLFQGNPPSKLDDEVLANCLANLQLKAPELISVLCISDLNDGSSSFESSYAIKHKSNQQRDLLKVNQLIHKIEDRWRVHSFTALLNESSRLGRVNENQVSNADSIMALNEIMPVPAKSKASQNILSIFSFPKGSQAGTFLHTLFEELNFSSGGLNQKIRRQYPNVELFISEKLRLSRLVEEPLINPWSAYLSKWLQGVLDVPLVDGLSLSSLNEGSYFAEMQFYFSIKQFNAEEFNCLLKTHTSIQEDIQFSAFEGHLKGAIDLVFEQNGKFYILDYKSNYLGDQLNDYSAENLENAMRDHRYDVQYIIYTLALHRYLKMRLGESYEYASHFGGVIYLFLRGLPLAEREQEPSSVENKTNGVYFTCPSEDLIVSLDQLVGML